MSNKWHQVLRRSLTLSIFKRMKERSARRVSSSTTEREIVKDVATPSRPFARTFLRSIRISRHRIIRRVVPWPIFFCDSLAGSKNPWLSKKDRETSLQPRPQKIVYRRKDLLTSEHELSINGRRI